MSVVKENNKCTIMWQNNSGEGNVNFMRTLFDCFKEGYEYTFTNLIDDEPLFTPMFKRVVLYKGNSYILALINDLNTVEEMHEFAKEHEIVIPEDITHRMKIKKFLKDYVVEQGDK